MSKSIILKNNKFWDASAVTYKRHKLSDIIYPVSCIYMSTNATSPASLFGGTWQNLSGRFLLGANSNYKVTTTGGSSTNDLSGLIHYSDSSYGLQRGSTAYAERQITGIAGKSSTEEQNYSPLKRINNMPPYYCVYMWLRVA